MFLGCFIHCKIKGIEILAVPSGMRWLVFARALFGFLSSMMAFAGIFYMPLSLAVVLYYTQPISASVISYFFNNEPLSVLQIFSILSSMLGVIFLSFPELLVPSLRGENTAQAERAAQYPHYELGVFLTLGGSICSGFAYLTMRKLGTTISSVVTTLYFGLFSFPACFVTSLILGDKFNEEPENAGIAIVLLLLVGIFGWVAQEGVSKAVGLAPAARMAPINYLQVVIAWLADILLFD